MVTGYGNDPGRVKSVAEEFDDGEDEEGDGVGVPEAVVVVVVELGES